jgi:hypothetical protein|eukprot:SAG25_NODE_36_length_19907_cov_10.787027_5_plen_109_part_00
MATQFEALLRRRGEWGDAGAALDRRRLEIEGEIELEGGLLRSELAELEEQLCGQHVASRRAAREAAALREDMATRDKLDVQIRSMVEKLTRRVQELELDNKRLREGKR